MSKISARALPFVLFPMKSVSSLNAPGSTSPTTILKLSVKAPAKSDHAEGETKAAGNVKERILEFVEQVESQDVNGGDWEVVGFVEPGAFKELTDFIGNNTKGKARAEILDMAVVHDGDS